MTGTEPLDDRDLLILGGLHDLFTAADAVPAGLVARVQFALELEDIDAEVSRLHEAWEPVGAGTRGDEESRTVTFDSDSVTIMVTMSPVDGGAVRLDGWLAPPAPYRVELRTAADRTAAVADAQGRFVFDAVPPGLAQIVVRGGEGRCVVTPSIVV